MKRFLTRIRAALLMGVMWAVAWMPIGPIIGFIVDRDGSMDEPWIMVGTLPGFLGGVVFSVVLIIAERRRRFDALTLKRVAGWGAVGGLLVGLIPFVTGDPSGGGPWPIWTLSIPVAITLMGAASAAGSLALARRSFNVIDEPADVAEVGPGGETSRKSG